MKKQDINLVKNKDINLSPSASNLWWMDNYFTKVGSNIFRYNRRWTICPSLKYKHSSDRCKVNKREASNYDDKGRNDNEALLGLIFGMTLLAQVGNSVGSLKMHYAPERSNRLIKTIIWCFISGYICKYSNHHATNRLEKNLTNVDDEEEI